MTHKSLAFLMGFTLLLVSCDTASEFGSNLAARWSAPNSDLPQKFMVASAHPHATAAGLEVLRKGGSAVDASIAVQMVLTLVEPESSGIGGGAFMLTFDPTTGTMQALDGRETAPASATPELHIGDNGKPLKFFDKVLGGKSVGVPGVVAMLEMAHNEHGTLPWEDLFGYAIKLAETGFEVSPKLNRWLTRLPTVMQMPDMKAYFTTDGVPFEIGQTITNPAYAETLRKIASGKSAAFYQGDIAAQIIKAVAQSPKRPATITQADFDAYEPKHRDIVCAPYRAWKICSMPPPSSGGITVLQTLGLLERFDMGALEPGSLEATHLIAEASRLAFADRDRYIADTDFVHVPVKGMIDAEYIAKRAEAIDPARSMGKALAGSPPNGGRAFLQGDDKALELPSTSHFSIIDGAGFAVAMTTSIEFAFGSHVMAGGFLLNNQLTDFSSVPQVNGKLVANRVQPGKRPRSSMSPTFVFDKDGDLYLILGSPGGSRIIGYVTKTLVGVLDWNLDMQDAIDLPNLVNRNGSTDVEPGLAHLKEGLEALGHQVKTPQLMMSGVNAIRITDRGFDGGADKRRIGTAEGE